MICKIKLLIILSITSIFLTSCVSLKQPQPEISYYTIAQLVEKPAATPLPLTLKVHRFSVAPLYNTIQMIYSEAPLTHNVYNYHKWGVNPGNMISDYLFRGIKQSNSFKAVFPYSSSTAALYTINGHVDEFYELDTKNGWEAHLALTITLLSEIEKDDLKKICFQKSYSSSKKCLKKNPRSLAGAMSRAASEITSEIIKDVYKALKD